MSSSEEADVLATISDGEPEEIATYNADPDTTCTICYAEFLEPEYLKIHLAHVHVPSNFILRICQFCSEEYTDMMDYAEHIRDYHISTLKPCTYCWRVFENAEAHREHAEKHIVNKFLGHYSCSQCRQWFSDFILLKKHEYEDHMNSEGVMLHEVLPYLSAVLKVKSITFIEAMSSDVVYICVGCSFSTVDIRTYVRHAKANICNVFVCHSCGNVFNKKNYLARHSKLNCDIYGRHSRKTQLCPDCNTHIPASSYNRHKNTCKPIKCFTCDIRFENMNQWSEHQSKEHAGTSVEVETCQYCWKRFVGTVALNRHIEKSHKPELHLYKYLCVYCKSIFKHPQKLFGHFLTRHKDILPYTCKICDKTFRFRKKFTIHIKLSHDSIGFVEFDKNYHVFFTDKKSENPFIPQCLYADEIQKKDLKNTEKDDILNITETEGNQTEVEVTKKPKLKRKRVSKVKQDNIHRINNDTSDDEPLLSVRKRIRIHKKIRLYKKKEKNKKLLTCNICNKYCYTFQNFNHHVSLHSRHEVKKCIKCPEIFKSKAKLEEHIKKEHSSSKLLETLKNLIEKRKNGSSIIDDLPTSEKFRRTIKRVKTETVSSSAIITTVDQKLSVQKFLENFVPDENKTDIETTASLKVMVGYAKEPTIKMTKFKPSPISDNLKLAMPVKFVDQNPEKVKLTVKIVQAPISTEENYQSDYYDDPPDMDTYESIPEVAEEVMLEGTDDGRKQNHSDIHKLNQSDVSQKIVIPKLPKDQVRDIQIAHLLPQAPFYKIIKVKDVLNQQQDEEDINEESNAPSSIKLPDGTKLVTANPLAHLLGNKQNTVLNSLKNKYYKPKNSNFPDMLAQALQTLDKPSFRKKKRNSIKTDEQ